uniref:Uncharacterized protein n=1 Tax=Palpitomonas bilix TaxID=652834 RepID=A0A7S3D3H4_9EUKA|mmetsp:Transcript_20378/g.52177  ORF Transcript_20378/g.52177 Transcript_20378/m.52177 type:complete len:458 (+) Transcript_20378:242-1615(+)
MGGVGDETSALRVLTTKVQMDGCEGGSTFFFFLSFEGIVPSAKRKTGEGTTSLGFSNVKIVATNLQCTYTALTTSRELEQQFKMAAAMRSRLLPSYLEGLRRELKLEGGKREDAFEIKQTNDGGVNATDLIFKVPVQVDSRARKFPCRIRLIESSDMAADLTPAIGRLFDVFSKIDSQLQYHVRQAEEAKGEVIAMHDQYEAEVREYEERERELLRCTLLLVNEKKRQIRRAQSLPPGEYLQENMGGGGDERIEASTKGGRGKGGSGGGGGGGTARRRQAAATTATSVAGRGKSRGGVKRRRVDDESDGEDDSNHDDAKAETRMEVEEKEGGNVKVEHSSPVRVTADRKRDSSVFDTGASPSAAAHQMISDKEPARQRRRRGGLAKADMADGDDDRDPSSTFTQGRSQVEKEEEIMLDSVFADVDQSRERERRGNQGRQQKKKEGAKELLDSLFTDF